MFVSAMIYVATSVRMPDIILDKKICCKVTLKIGKRNLLNCRDVTLYLFSLTNYLNIKQSKQIVKLFC